MEHRSLNENYKRIAEGLIDSEPELEYIKDSRVRIAYLESDQCKKSGKDRLVQGECEKVAAKNQWAIDYDFTITIFVNNVIGMNEEQVKILLFHELMHICIDVKEDGEEVYSTRKHDIEDFKLIVKKYGMDWSNRLERE